MASAYWGNSTYSYKPYSNGSSVLLPQKISYSPSGFSISSSVSNKFSFAKISTPPKWLYKTHNKVMHKAQTWEKSKQQQSINHAFNALSIQQDLYAYKRDELSQSTYKRKFSCFNYFSKEHKMGRALNKQMTGSFFPLESMYLCPSL